MMGLDPDQRVRLYKWSDAMMAGDSAADSDDDPLMLAAAEAFGEYAGMCLELIAERREQPDARDDIITALTRAYDEGALAREDRAGQEARKSVGEGKSVAVSVDLGGRRSIKKKKKNTIT